MTRSDGGLGTFLVGGKGLKTLAQNLNRAKAGSSTTHDKRMRMAETEIRQWCTQINAPDAVMKNAFTLMTDMLRQPETQHLIRGKQNKAVRSLSIIYIHTYIHTYI